MKKIVFGTALVGAAILGLRVAARHGHTMCVEHCGQTCGEGSECAQHHDALLCVSRKHGTARDEESFAPRHPGQPGQELKKTKEREGGRRRS